MSEARSAAAGLGLAGGNAADSSDRLGTTLDVLRGRSHRAAEAGLDLASATVSAGVALAVTQKEGEALRESIKELREEFPGLAREIERLDVLVRGGPISKLRQTVLEAKDAWEELKTFQASGIGVIGALTGQYDEQAQAIGRTVLELRADTQEREESLRSAALQLKSVAETARASGDLDEAMRSGILGRASEIETAFRKLGVAVPASIHLIRDALNDLPGDKFRELLAASAALAADTRKEMEKLGGEVEISAEAMDRASRSRLPQTLQEIEAAAEKATAALEAAIRQYGADMREMEKATEEWADAVREESVEAFEKQKFILEQNVDAILVLMRAEQAAAQEQGKLTAVIEGGVEALEDYEIALEAVTRAREVGRGADAEYVAQLEAAIRAEREAAAGVEASLEAAREEQQAKQAQKEFFADVHGSMAVAVASGLAEGFESGDWKQAAMSTIEALFTVAGAAIGFAIGGPAGGQAGAVLGGAVGGLFTGAFESNVTPFPGGADALMEQIRQLTTQNLPSLVQAVSDVFAEIHAQLQEVLDLFGVVSERFLDAWRQGIEELRNRILGVTTEFADRLEAALLFNAQLAGASGLVTGQPDQGVPGGSVEPSPGQEAFSLTQDAAGAAAESLGFVGDNLINVADLAHQLILELAGVDFGFQSLDATLAAMEAQLQAAFDSGAISLEEFESAMALLAETAADQRQQLEIDALGPLLDMMIQFGVFESEAREKQAELLKFQAQLDLKLIEAQLVALGVMDDTIRGWIDALGEAIEGFDFGSLLGGGGVSVPDFGGGLGGGLGAAVRATREDFERAIAEFEMTPWALELFEAKNRFADMREEFKHIPGALERINRAASQFVEELRQARQRALDDALAPFELSALEQSLRNVRLQFADLREEFEGFPGALRRIRAAEGEAIQQALEAHFKPLIDFRQSLDSAGLADPQRFQQAGERFAELAAMPFDEIDPAALAQAGQEYERLIESMFGKGHRRGQALIDEMRGTIDEVLAAAGLETTGDPKLDAANLGNSYLKDIRNHLLGMPPEGTRVLDFPTGQLIASYETAADRIVKKLDELEAEQATWGEKIAKAASGTKQAVEDGNRDRKASRQFGDGSKLEHFSIRGAPAIKVRRAAN